jgi:hypothetical protein
VTRFVPAHVRFERLTMAADHRDLVRARAHDKGNPSTSLKGLAAEGLMTITRTPSGTAEQRSPKFSLRLWLANPPLLRDANILPHVGYNTLRVSG